MATNFNKNVTVSRIRFVGSIMGQNPREFFATESRDLSNADAMQLFTACTRYMRSVLRSEEVAHASMWAVDAASIAVETSTESYEISNADFLKIATKIERTEASDYFMTRTISGGGVVSVWNFGDYSGEIFTPAKTNILDEDTDTQINFMLKNLPAMRKEVAKQLAKQGAPADICKQLAKAITPTPVSFEEGESGLYGATYAALQPYKIA